jgi:hypothetical protein
LIYLKLGIDQKSFVDENSDDISEIVNCSPSAELSKLNISVNKVEKEKFETNFSSVSFKFLFYWYENCQYINP